MDINHGSLNSKFVRSYGPQLTPARDTSLVGRRLDHQRLSDPRELEQPEADILPQTSSWLMYGVQTDYWAWVYPHTLSTPRDNSFGLSGLAAEGKADSSGHIWDLWENSSWSMEIITTVRAVVIWKWEFKV